MNESARVWLLEARAEVDAALATFLGEKRREAEAVDPEALALAEEIEALSLRGGKRLRGALVILGHELAGGTSPEPVLPAAVAFELLQSHLLIQDDWMDQDARRRGGPSVHHALATKLADDHLGASLAILASDVAFAWALESLLDSKVPAEHRLAASRLFGSIETEVVYGQLLDVLAAADTEKIHRLKTAGYTVAGPLRLGATLGGGEAALLAALQAFGTPLGLAFQLRDDLLGVFGEPELTGKAVGADLRAGKRTLIVSLAERLFDAEARELLELVYGNPEIGDEEVTRLTDLFETLGVRAKVEAKAAGLEAEAMARLAEIPGCSSVQTERLAGLVELLASRRA